MDKSKSTLACPFCGDKHVTVSEYDTKDAWWAQCDNIHCGAEGPTRRTAEEARSAWNVRAGGLARGTRTGRGSLHGVVGRQVIHHSKLPKTYKDGAWSIAGLDAMEASVASAISHWHEFGPEHGFEECIHWLEVRLEAYRRQKESASNGALSSGGEAHNE